MSAGLSHQFPVARKTDLVVTPLADEVVLYDMAANQLHTLNSTAAFVWQQCDGHTSVATIAQRFAQTYGLPDGADLVWSALDQLGRQNLLQTSVERPTWVAGITRRELMTRTAVGALALVPLVRSLVAPTPAHAQSGPTTLAPTTTATTTTPTTTLAPTTTATTTTPTTTLAPTTTATTTTPTTTLAPTTTATTTTAIPGPTIGRFWHP